MAVPDPNPALEHASQAVWPGLRLEMVDTLDSTNSELMRRAHAGRKEAVLLVAARQTAGRGRLGRTWISAQTDSQGQCGAHGLTFSLGLPLNPLDWSGLSLAVGLSLAQSLHPDIQLKWPNDLWWQGRKLAGILIETVQANAASHTPYAVLGVGVNLGRPEDATLHASSAGLHELWPGINGRAVLERTVPGLLKALRDFETRGFTPLRSDFDARDALRGREIALAHGVPATVLGVDAQGALVVQSATGQERIVHSEVSLLAPGAARSSVLPPIRGTRACP